MHFLNICVDCVVRGGWGLGYRNCAPSGGSGGRARAHSHHHTARVSLRALRFILCREHMRIGHGCPLNTGNACTDFITRTSGHVSTPAPGLGHVPACSTKQRKEVLAESDMELMYSIIVIFAIMKRRFWIS
jgi:hypothetical protein